MRLLQCSDTGGFSPTKDFLDGEALPPYAILSHTWEDGQEITYKDLMDDTGKSKRGYDKIQFCGQQAERDGLEYFWVDTCCIDKSNHVEVQKAINSMFRWYQNAVKCYVYLSDVSIAKRKASDGVSEYTWEPAFRQSRWFARGWTLQELLAPNLVEFYSRERKKFGDKRSLKQQIHEITGIPDTALIGAPLSQFSEKERFSWIQCRQTKVEEDKAYSLLGIFDVEMPLRYGEGAASAFKRLDEEIDKLNKCLGDLRSTDPRHDKKRIEDTNSGLLEDSYRWILENSDFQRWRNDEQSRLLWIQGDPGKGKTMLLCGIIDEFKKSMAKTDLLSYFFCQATDSRINSATAVLRGLLFLLINQQPSLVSHIQKNHDHAGKALFEDANAWVTLSEIFTHILQDPSLNSTYLIIDALDECVTDLPKLLDFVVQKSCVSPRVKWIVSGRNQPNIEERLNRIGHKVMLSLELNAGSVSTAVSVFIQDRVRQLAERKNYDEKTRDTVLDHLSLHANDTFLWVALVCQNLQNTPRRKTLSKLNSLPPGLSSLYERMMQQICNLDDMDDSDICKRVLALITIVYRPITLEELTSLIGMHEDVADDLESLQEIIDLCGSFLTVRQGTIYFVHQSAKDFLVTKSFNDIFPSGKEGDVHYAIFLRSLQVMSKTLKRDVYCLGALGYPAEQVRQPDPDPLAAVRYSCVYWIDHLYDWNYVSAYDWNSDFPADHSVDLQDGGVVHEFMEKKYLYWLEALSLCKSMSKVIASVAKLGTLIQLYIYNNNPFISALTDLFRDGRRFIMYHKRAIEMSPLQAYVSALVFSPARSIIRGLFKKEEPTWITIKPDIGDKWGACLQTLEGHSARIESVAFSHDAPRLASASYDKTFRLWDTSSGECLQMLEGHTIVSYSHRTSQLASASYNNTVKIWDTNSGRCLQTFEGHNNPIASVAFSHDSTRLASASIDKTVRIWETNSGKCLHTVEGHSDTVGSVIFSHDSTRLASASLDGTIKVWAVSCGQCLQTLIGHSDSVESIAFSHNSALLASASDDKTVKIWDTVSGECLRTLKGHSNEVTSVAFSSESTRLASASFDRTVRVWAVGSGQCLQTLRGHSYGVESVAFSHTGFDQLASASRDGTIKIWDTLNGDWHQTSKGESDWIWVLVSSLDSAWLASASEDNTVKIWEISSGKCIQTLEGHNGRVMSIAFSRDSTQLVSGSTDKTVKLWDMNSFDCLQTFEYDCDYAASIAFSYDSTWVISTLTDWTVKIWDASNGKCLQTLNERANSVALSHDSTRLARALCDHIVVLSDIESGYYLQTFEGHTRQVTSIAFSYDLTKLASASYDETVRIWDTSSGECLQTLKVGMVFEQLSFDPTGSYLHTENGTIDISFLSNLNVLPSISEPQYRGLGLSSDKAWITYDSRKLVWLPTEYRSERSVVVGDTIGVGVGSGDVWIFKVNGSEAF